MAQRLAVTIFVTAVFGTLSLIGLERLTIGSGVSPSRAFALMVPYYLLFAVVAWKSTGRLQRRWQKREKER